MPEPFMILKTEKDIYLSGTINKQFLSEPINSIAIRHGNKSVREMYAVGIVEKGINDDKLNAVPLLAVNNELSKILIEQFILIDTMKIAPIAIFRDLNYSSRADTK